MHIVYKLTFLERKRNNLLPYQYIGSKSNVEIIDGIMYGKRGKYFSSSRSKLFLEALKEEIPFLEVLYIEEFNYNAILMKERELHLELDVSANPTFFNMSIAGINTFSDPKFATYKNIETGKIARLQRKHPKVIDGTWVGISKGTILSEERKEKIRKWNRENENYWKGKHLREETKTKLSISAKKRYEGIDGIELRRNASERCRNTFTGRPKSVEHRKKISRPGFIMIKHSLSGETKRIKIEDRIHYDDKWTTPYALREKKYGCCIHCKKEGELNSTFRRWHMENCKRKLDEN